jgi:hypothetical protein
MLFIGLQFIVWSVSGTYMVLMDIDYIHGDSLVSENSQYLMHKQVNYSFNQLLKEYPQASRIELGLLLDKAVYRFNIAKQQIIVLASNGQKVSPIGKDIAIAIAQRNYANKAAVIVNVTLITDNPPRELSSRHLPAWRIDFDDFASPSFFISTNKAQIVTKRHSFWRIFDWMFAFHVMDYIDEEADNKLLLIFSVLAFIGCVFGLVLTYFRFKPKHNNGMLNKNIKLKSMNKAE